MKIMGLQKTTLLDYPGMVAATIFLGGCNMRCPFCHNMNIVENSSLIGEYSITEIIDFLQKRQGILDGVCITGGEPTLHPELPDFLTSIRNLGYKIKLDTNGTNPSLLENLIEANLIDYVAMDIKSSLDTYELVSGVKGIDTSKVVKSIHLLNNSSIDHEFRTTIIKDFHNLDTMEEIGKLLEGSKKYFLQSFVDSEFVPDHSLSSYKKEELLGIKSALLKYIDYVDIRGID